MILSILLFYVIIYLKFRRKVGDRVAKIDEWLEQDKLILLEGWARDGLTYEQIANNIGIDVTTLREWRKKESTISTSLKKGREVADYEVENALFKRALGYTYEEKTYEDGILKKVVTKEVAPDTTAQIYWLKNRKPKEWRDKQDYDSSEELAKLDKLLEEQKNAYMDN